MTSDPPAESDDRQVTTIRLTPALHRELKIRAAVEGTSVNQLLTEGAALRLAKAAALPPEDA